VPAELTRAAALRGGAALLLGASGLAALAPPAAATPPDSSLGALPAGDLAYVRLLIALELLTIDFWRRALASGRLTRAQRAHARLARANERDHYGFLARVLAGAGGTPLTAADIGFRYPRGGFGSAGALLDLAIGLETLALSTYLGAVAGVATPALAGALAQGAANEAQHRAAFAAAAHARLYGDAFPAPLTIEEASDALDAFTS